MSSRTMSSLERDFEKSHLNKLDRAVRGHGGSPAHVVDAGLCRRRRARGPEQLRHKLEAEGR